MDHLTLQDPWALRAVPAAEGSIDRIRVTNLCLARQLCQVEILVFCHGNSGAVYGVFSPQIMGILTWYILGTQKPVGISN